MIFLECKDKDQSRKLKHFSPLADSKSVRGGGCCYVHRHYWQWGPALRASNFHSVGQFEIIAQHWYMHQPEPPIRNVRNFMSNRLWSDVILAGGERTHHHPALSTLPQIQWLGRCRLPQRCEHPRLSHWLRPGASWRQAGPEGSSVSQSISAEQF